MTILKHIPIYINSTYFIYTFKIKSFFTYLYVNIIFIRLLNNIKMRLKYSELHL